MTVSGVEAQRRESEAAPGGLDPSPSGRSPAETRRVALHEAGHVFVSRFFGHVVARATIIPDPLGNYAGAVWGGEGLSSRRVFSLSAEASLVEVVHGRIMPPPGAKRKQETGNRFLYAWECCVELMAGVAAETLVFGNSDKSSGYADRRVASMIASEISSVPERLLVFAKNEAVAIVSQYRPVVLAIAEALERVEEMTGAEIDSVIRTALVAEDARLERMRRAEMKAMRLRAATFKTEKDEREFPADRLS